jgi:hypothetical protein
MPKRIRVIGLERYAKCPPGSQGPGVTIHSLFRRRRVVAEFPLRALVSAQACEGLFVDGGVGAQTRRG